MIKKHNEKFAFFGSPEFAAIILKNLVDSGHIPQAVVCNPDKPVGRKKIITPPPVKVLAEKYNIETLQPEKLSDIKSQLLNFNCQFFILASYSKIIKKEILDIPKLGVIGVHPSILPKYRGPSPIQSVLLAGEKETGVSLYLMDEKIDNGPIINKSEIQISKSETYETLMRKLAELGGNLLVKTLPDFIAGKIKPQPQDHSQTTFTHKFKTQDAFINYSDLETALNKEGQIAIEIFNKIRGFYPEPGAWTVNPPTGGGKRMKILKAELTEEGKLKLKTIQYEGKLPSNLK